MNILNFATENWFFCLACLSFLINIIIAIVYFIKLPTEEKKLKITSWLLWAVTKAEKEMGAETGAIKLQYVYDMFIQRFPIISKFLTYNTFFNLVNDALKEMRALLANNTNINAYVKLNIVEHDLTNDHPNIIYTEKQ